MLEQDKQDMVLLEGFHACKHALRFRAEILELVTPDKVLLEEMIERYAPDIREYVDSQVQEISEEKFASYSDTAIRTPLAARARIPRAPLGSISSVKPLVVLENPRDLENIGAVVRVAAGLGLAGVCTTGEHNPWHKNAVRTSQGTHFALPVVHTDEDALQNTKREVWVFDESGEVLEETFIPQGAMLVFGSERQGVSKAWLERADRVVRISQSDKVSSYNLATAVAMAGHYVIHQSVR